MKNVTVIGSGFAGLAASCVLAAKGCKVSVYEKNKQTGGRARTLQTDGYTFDMGPSWYWMPDVFERFFSQFGFSTSDFYELKKLSPSFSVFFGKNEIIDIPSDFDSLCQLFENIEKGSGGKLKIFLKEAAYKYNVGVNKLVYKPGLSFKEFADIDLLAGIFKLQVFSSFSKHVKKYFKDPRLIAIMEFPVLFLGAKPQDTPALYSLMNYAGLQLGTWYPMGGFEKVTEGMKTIATSLGAQFYTGTPIENFDIEKNNIKRVMFSAHNSKPTDAVIGSADYNHIEQQLLPPRYRTYSREYWDTRVFAPSALIFYLGIKKRISKLRHHNLFFDEDFSTHAEEIYDSPQWPSKPLFYVCCPSKTDAGVAPEGCENLFVLMPLAPGVSDTEKLRDNYFTIIMDRLELLIGEKIRQDMVVKKSYCINNFEEDYNAYKGNAYGLANTLFQTAIFKPSIKSKKINNLFYAGQLTVPGPGVPPAIISGQVAAQELLKYLKLA